MKTTSKTFQKGDDYGELIEWFMKQIKTHEYQPEGISSYGDGLCPFDPVCELKHKYTIKIIEKSEQEPI